jgi:hypothetical protein
MERAVAPYLITVCPVALMDILAVHVPTALYVPMGVAAALRSVQAVATMPAVLVRASPTRSAALAIVPDNFAFLLCYILPAFVYSCIVMQQVNYIPKPDECAG